MSLRKLKGVWEKEKPVNSNFIPFSDSSVRNLSKILRLFTHPEIS